MQYKTEMLTGENKENTIFGQMGPFWLQSCCYIYKRVR